MAPISPLTAGQYLCHKADIPVRPARSLRLPLPHGPHPHAAQGKPGFESGHSEDGSHPPPEEGKRSSAAAQSGITGKMFATCLIRDFFVDLWE